PCESDAHVACELPCALCGEEASLELVPAAEPASFRQGTEDSVLCSVRLRCNGSRRHLCVEAVGEGHPFSLHLLEIPEGPHLIGSRRSLLSEGGLVWDDGLVDLGSDLGDELKLCGSQFTPVEVWVGETSPFSERLFFPPLAALSSEAEKVS